MKNDEILHWYFIFGAEHEMCGKYVHFYDTYTSARDRMNRCYGETWQLQLSKKLFNELNKQLEEV